MAITLDLETRSEVDLKKVGSHIYSKHPSTVILCIGFKKEDSDEKYMIRFPELEALRTQGIKSENIRILERFVKHEEFVAHNAYFEKVMWQNCIVPKYGIPYPEHWRCTLAKCLMYGLPANLEDALINLGLGVFKDKEGKKVMLSLSKPRPYEQTTCQGCQDAIAVWKTHGKQLKLCDACYHHPVYCKTKGKDKGVPYKATAITTEQFNNNPSDFARLYSYCMDDVIGTEKIDLFLPDQLSELQVWQLDQIINFRGIAVDTVSVDHAIEINRIYDEKLKAQASEITGKDDKFLKSPVQLLDYFQSQGEPLKNINKETLREKLEQPLTDEVALIISLRQEASKTSTGKYNRFQTFTAPDGRMYDILQYHGTITGRWKGKNVQVQNFPRPKDKTLDIDAAIELLNYGSEEMFEDFYPDVKDVLSVLTRSMCTAGEGKLLVKGDFSQIECRVLAALANQKNLLEDFEQKKDPYRSLASVTFGVDIVQIKKDSEERQIGKVGILGCGYGMGWRRFKEQVKNQVGLEIEDALAVQVVNSYRALYPNIVKFWGVQEKAAMRAVLKPNTLIKAGRIDWYFDTSINFLKCYLPSGRYLSYHKPRVMEIMNNYGEMKPQLMYMRKNPKTFQYELTSSYGGKLTENIVSGTARDVMVESMFKCEAQQFPIVLTCHDEVVCEVDEDKAQEATDRIEVIMTQRPKWCQDFPIAVDMGKPDKRYKK